MLSTNVGDKVCLSWIVEGLFENSVRHILLSDGKTGNLLLANKLDWSIRVGLHHLAGKVRCTLDATLLEIVNHPLRRLEQ